MTVKPVEINPPSRCSWFSLVDVNSAFNYIYNKNKTFVYMFPVAGQTAGTNDLTFLEETLEYPGEDIG